jgi:hypothetical protein
MVQTRFDSVERFSVVVGKREKRFFFLIARNARNDLHSQKGANLKSTHFSFPIWGEQIGRSQWDFDSVRNPLPPTTHS